MAVSSNEVSIDLAAIRFTETESRVAETPGIVVTAFRYASGVAALRIINQVGEIVVLPFHGQQIWDAQFHGRRLTMRSVFDTPTASQNYLENYGAFFLHCGATAMGNPGPKDTHPLHGELPNAQFQRAWLLLGHDAQGAYASLAGTYQHRLAFGAHYEFSPRLRLPAHSGRMALDISIRNLRSKPMDLMYLAHINFRPEDGARIVDAIPDDPRHMRVRNRLPEFFTPQESYRALIAQLSAEPAGHRRIEPGRAIDPELVMGLDCVAGVDGWAHAMQQRTDGSADFVSHRPAELNHAVRWMTRNGDEDALGLVLPATAEADGLSAERAKGNVRQLAPGGEFRCGMAFGALTPEQAAGLAAQIEGARPRA